MTPEASSTSLAARHCSSSCCTSTAAVNEMPSSVQPTWNGHGGCAGTVNIEEDAVNVMKSAGGWRLRGYLLDTPNPTPCHSVRPTSSLTPKPSSTSPAAPLFPLPHASQPTSSDSAMPHMLANCVSPHRNTPFGAIQARTLRLLEAIGRATPRNTLQAEGQAVRAGADGVETEGEMKEGDRGIRDWEAEPLAWVTYTYMNKRLVWGFW